MNWGNSDPFKRGPVVATVKHGGQRNAIGAHGGFKHNIGSISPITLILFILILLKL
jgi:hypothetical protein